MAEPTKYFVALWHEKIVARFSSNIVWTRHFECSRPGNLYFMAKVRFSYIRSTRRLSWSIEILPGRDPIERDLTRVFQRHLTSVRLLVYHKQFEIASSHFQPIHHLWCDVLKRNKDDIKIPKEPIFENDDAKL